jgi:transcriptional regulator with XRE-family HTH domain
MAIFLQVTPRHYQEIEYGKINVSCLTLIALADYFDVSLDYLTGRADNPDSHKN